MQEMHMEEKVPKKKEVLSVTVRPDVLRRVRVEHAVTNRCMNQIVEEILIDHFELDRQPVASGA
jgi:hypothetical protein